MKNGMFLLLAITLALASQTQAQNDTLFNKDFNDENLNSGGWTSQLVSGADNCEWTTSSFSNPTPYARITNYISGDYTSCESWLISPMVDLSSATPFLNFRNAYNYSGNQLQLMVSSDYMSGNVSSATWVDITDLATWSNGDFAYANSGNIDLSAYTIPNIHIAFKYTGGNSDGSTWNLDDITLFSTQPVDADGWNCTSTGCIESISGSGVYATFEECDPMCEVVEPDGWDCIANACTESTSGSGEFTSFNDCQSICETVENPTTSIYEIQYTEQADGSSDLLDQTVETGGVVTALRPDGSGYYIQNGSGPWSGIYVFDNSNSPAIGDSLTFSADVYEFYNLTELKNLTNYTVVSSGNMVVTSTVSPQMANSEAYEGVLIKLFNVQCVEAPNQYNEWMAGDGTNSVIINDFIYFYEAVLNNYYNVIGIVDYSFDEFKVCPRMESDVTTGTTDINVFTSSLLQVYPNPSSGIIQVDDTGVLEIFTLSGQLVYSKLLNGKLIDLNDLCSGTYLCKLLDNKGNLKGTDKLVVN
jgi:hypothetical protein